ncbi:MAG TPA: hypothetical protein VL285_19715 [Bryobacteraceae bacterium]|nr:hypothetical protein [Bryobacteraceae bacterium]
MNRVLSLFLAVVSIASADIAVGKSLTQGNVTIMLTKYSNRPFPETPGIPQVAPELLREGVTVFVTTTSATTTGFKVTVKYRDGDSILTATGYADRSDVPDAKGAAATFEIGSAAVASVQVEELIRQSSAEFTE